MRWGVIQPHGLDTVARAQALELGPVLLDLIASAAEAEEVLSPEELDELDRAAAVRAQAKGEGIDG